MRKIFTLFIWLLLLPVTALAAGNDRPHSLYVGNTNFASTIYPDNAAYWTSSDGGTNWTSQLEKPTGDSYIHYNGQGTLTLHNANIQGQYDSSNRYSGYGIYAVGAPGDAVSLTIQLEGTNTVSGWSGIFVHAVDGAASLSISGTGSLATEGTGGISFSGIVVQGNGGKAELTINNVDVTATNTSDSAQGILLQSADSSPATLTVNGGELTASGQRAGIKYVFGSSGTGGGTPTVTVSNNAIVRANGGISDDSSTDIQIGADSNESNGGIVFDGKNGTVYGNVSLQEDITIGEGESLTLDDGASLNTGDYTLTVDGGTLTGNVTGKVTYKVTGVSLSKASLTLDVGGTEDLIATITPETATDKNLTWASDANGVATVDQNGKVNAVAPGTANITVTTQDGSHTATCAVTVTQPVTGVTLDPTSLSLFTGDTATLTATVEPENATNKNVTWSSDKPEVATVENGKVTAKAAGTATITATAEDDSDISATCTVTVTQSEYSISADTTALDFGSAYTGYTQPAAQTVTITNTGNQSLNLNQPASTSSFEVGTLSTTELAAGATATFTVQPKAGLSVGTYSENIAVTSSEGATLSITASFNVRKEVKVEPSGSTNLSFTTDRDEFTLTAIVYGENLSQEPNCWEWTVEDKDVVERVTLRSKAVSYSTSRQAFTIKGTGTTTITATYDDGTYRGSEEFKVSISKPTPPDPISYYNIYVEDVCDGVEVTLSNNVVREGNSISVYVKKDTANYTFDNFKVYYKRSYYGGWEELKEGTQPGEYPIKNIWTHIYIKAEGAEVKEDPTGIESIEGVKVYTKDGSLYVQTPQREQVLVISMSGAVVKNEEQVGLKQYHGLQPGIYIVRVGDRAYKLRLN